MRAATPLRYVADAAASVFVVVPMHEVRGPGTGLVEAALVSPAHHEKALHSQWRTLTATLLDHPASREFAAMLPLRLQLRDYASAEKIADLPRKLTTQGVPPGTSAQFGDLSYYASWGNIVLFYKEAPYANGLIRLGRIDTRIETLRTQGEGAVLVELVKD